MFLKSTQVYGVNGLAALKTQPEVKKQIQNFVTDAVKRGIIQPFKRKVKNSIDGVFKNNR